MGHGSGEISLRAVPFTSISKGAMQCPRLLWNWINSDYFGSSILSMFFDNIMRMRVGSTTRECLSAFDYSYLILKAHIDGKLTSQMLWSCQGLQGSMTCCVGLPFGLSKDGFMLTKRLQDLGLKALHPIPEVFKTFQNHALIQYSSSDIMFAYYVCICSQDHNMQPIQAANSNHASVQNPARSCEILRDLVRLLGQACILHNA